MNSRRIPMVLPALLILTAFTLRVYHLDHLALWGDEAITIAVSRWQLARVVAGGTDTLPPFFITLLHFWLLLAGDSVFAIRYLSALPGLMLVVAIYVLGRRLIGSQPALLAGGLAAISPFAIYYSQETRAYAWAAMWTALSVYTFLRLLAWDFSQRRKGEALPRPYGSTAAISTHGLGLWRAAYLITTLAAMYSHYYAFFVILAENLYALWHWRKQRAGLLTWIAGQVALAAAYLPWIMAQTGYLSGKANARFDAWGLSGMYDVWVRSLIAFGGGTGVPPNMKWAALGVAILVAAGVVVVLRRRSAGSDQGFLVMYLIVPMLVAWLVGPIMPFFYERFLIVAFPAYLLLLAVGLAALMRSRSPLPVLGGFGLAFVVAVSAYSLNNTYHNPAYAKSGYRDLMAYVARQSRPGDGLLLLNPEQRYLYDYYGFKGIPAYWFPPVKPWDDPTTQAEMAGIESSHSRLWLVLFGNARDWDFGHGLENWLSQHAFRAYHGDYVDGGLELYIVGSTKPTEPAEADFAGVIRLTGYGVSSATISPGDTLQVALSWLALQKMDRDYTIFTHLIDDQQKIWGQMDSPPMGGAHPTSAWQVGETLTDRLALQVDPSTPPGTYWLEVGWYDLVTSERLPLLDAQGKETEDRLLLVQIEIK